MPLVRGFTPAPRYLCLINLKEAVGRMILILNICYRLKPENLLFVICAPGDPSGQIGMIFYYGAKT